MNNFNHTFKKRFGQNFLKSDKWPSKIAKYLAPSSGEIVIEIGPGQGALTEKLLSNNAEVYAVEIDKELYPLLEATFRTTPNFQLIKQDILQLDIESSGNKIYSVVGSLPYNISKKIIEKFLTTNNKPQKMLFIIQKEVAEDYTARAPRASFLSIFANIYADVKYLNTINKSEFYPQPEVDGAILEFTNITPKYAHHQELRKFIRSGYLQPRKKLSSCLASQGYTKTDIENCLQELTLQASARAGELTLENWNTLFLNLTNKSK